MWWMNAMKSATDVRTKATVTESCGTKGSPPLDPRLEELAEQSRRELAARELQHHHGDREDQPGR